MKAQIALEFLIMLSFVLIVFIFLLYVISSQRALGLSSQSFSQLQIEAQSISMQLTKASSAGNGFSGQIPTYTTPNTKTYNLTITKNGLVILQQKIGSQIITATSFSYVKGIYSNPYFLSPTSSSAYIIPVSNGTINVQNSFGAICIDYNCPNSTGSPAQVSLTAQNTYAAQFNGQNSYISVPSPSPSLAPTSQISAFAWVYSYSEPPVSGCPGIISYSNSGATYGYALYLEGGCAGTPSGVKAYLGNGADFVVTSTSTVISQNKWELVGLTYNGLNLCVWINTVPTCASGSGSISYTGASFYLGANWGAGPFNGLISNAQIYNTGLSSNQISQLYSEGINGAPVSPANLVGWWPLNGNANDYSGNNNNGKIIGFVPFVSVSEIFAKVLSAAGQPLNDVLVGFSSTLGQLSNQGNGISSYNYTNSNGMATTFLNSNFSSGYANVRATAFNGNASSQQSLVGWWPMNMGQGNIIPDISHFLASGAATNGVYWNSPNYAASFDGYSSFVEAPASNSLNPGSSLTLSAWIMPSSYANCAGPSCIILNKESEYEIAVNQNGALESAIQPNWAWYSSTSTMPLDTWSLVTVTWSGTYENLYINGVLSGSYNLGGGSVTPDTNCLYIGARGCPNAASSFFHGSISNVQLYNTALTGNQISLMYAGGISAAPIAPSNLMAWYPLNGNANDYSGNGNTGSTNGNLQFSPINANPPAFINQSSVTVASFNGVSSYINITSKPSLNSGHNYTVSGWYSTNSASTGIIWSSWNGATSGYQMYLQAGQPAFYAGGTTEIAPNSIASSSSWYQIAGVFNSGGEGTLYVNGIQVAQGTIGSLASSGNNQIGAQYDGAALNYFFNGLISNIQVYNASLTPHQIDSIYLSGLQGLPINTQSLVGWWPLNGNANDYGINKLNGVPTNVIYVSQSNFVPSGTSSLGPYGVNFNGASGYIQISPSSSLAVSGPFSVSLWFSSALPPTTSFDSELISTRLPTDTTFDMQLIGSGGYFGSGSGLHGDIGNGAGSWLSTSVNYPFTFTQNVWYHIIIVFTTTGWTMYLNGRQVSSGTLSGTPSLLDTNSYLLIGAYSNTGANNFKGSIANVQLYNTALSAQQVSQLYDSSMPVTSSINIPVGWSP